MEPVCQGCILGFHNPEDHLPSDPHPWEKVARMYVLAKTYVRAEDVEEGFSEGLLTVSERRFLLIHLLAQEIGEPNA
jgi:hypothetical protein